MPATPFFAGQFTGNTNAMLNVPDYSIELQAVVNNLFALNSLLTKQLGALNTIIAYNTGPLGKETSGTLSASLNSMARSVSNMATNSSSIMTKQGEIVSALNSVQTAVARVSSTINAGVTTQQMAYSEQTNHNKFQEQTTNAALARSGLPPTVVTEESLLEKFDETIETTLNLKSQVFSTNIVAQGLTEAITWTAITVQNNVAETFVGAGAASWYGSLKGWLAKVNSGDFAKQARTEADKIRSESQYI
jgi:hypothetical protein